MLMERLTKCFLLVAATSLAAAACGGGGADTDAPADTAAAVELPPLNPLLDPGSAQFAQTAPDTFRVQFETSKGNFTVQVYRAWAPNGADRFYNLASNGYYDGVRFFRVIDDFMAQFGIHGDPLVSATWRSAPIQDDPVVGTNARGTITFAKSSLPNSRTTQVFINLINNTNLDELGFAPFGEVTVGMDVVDQIFSGYGDGPPNGAGPDQGRLQTEGEPYMAASFAQLDQVTRATIVP